MTRKHIISCDFYDLLKNSTEYDHLMSVSLCLLLQTEFSVVAQAIPL